MATPKEKYETELRKYQQARKENSKEKYYTKLYNTITDFNDHNNTPLSSMDIWEAVLRVMKEDE